jgi:RimJ/RimL family protein N-acetyltransferase
MMCKSRDNNDLQIRPAKDDDAECLREWANDPVTRQNSFDTEPISWKTHQTWYAARLSSPDTRMWILELRGQPVGQIRYDRTDVDTAQISFSIAPKFRGRSLGTNLLCLSLDLAGRELRVRWAEGIVFQENRGSINAFVKSGFELVEKKTIAGHASLVFRRSCSRAGNGACCASVH